MTLRTVTAHHEAGHALMAVCVGFQVVSLDVSPQDYRFGRASILETVPLSFDANDQAHRLLIERSILVGLAGPAAELVYRMATGLQPSFGPQDAMLGHGKDFAKVNDQLCRLGFASAVNLERNTRFGFALSRVQHRDFWSALTKLAQRLCLSGEVDPEEIRELSVGLPRLSDDFCLEYDFWRRNFASQLASST